MLLYNFSFPKDGICREQELYLRGAEVSNSGVFVKDGSTVTFDTYFNSFSHIKYKKYTGVRMVTLKLSLDGKGIARIFRYISGGKNELVIQKQVCGEDTLAFDISSIPDKGFLYLSFTANGDCALLGGSWNGDAEPRKVKIGIVICTYKREEYLKRNVANLSEYMRLLGEDRFFDVFIVDNARTLRDDFGEGFTLIPNKNTGGSGGFTRGMKEVCARDYTHFLLMDDDILFDLNILRRTASMLSILKENCKNASIGGGMLELDRPYHQHELGAYWTGAGMKSCRGRLDARERETVCGNEENPEPDYNAWFYMCMPVSSAQKYGYPLPFFISDDDIEYGLRAAEHIIVTSGIAVWHESFDNKYMAEKEYYSRRNELITSARFPKGKGFFANWSRLFLNTGRSILLQRYFAADLHFKAYDDFFKGPEYFLNLDSEQNHIALGKYRPRFLTEAEIEKEYGISVKENISASYKPIKVKNIFSLFEYFIPKCFFKKELTQVDMMRRSAKDVFMKRRLLHFNSFSGTGFVTEIKKSAIFKYTFKSAAYFFKMLFGFRRMAKKYAAIDVKAL